ncbi:hypothetical protein ACSFA2_17780 [Variovorax sp. LT2P21]|uniref:hypothetical protein n=1 Tax=Variovorax sp. LT2P21 TaxID=3443731 RepID=UPI003F481EBF
MKTVQLAACAALALVTLTGCGAKTEPPSDFGRTLAGADIDLITQGQTLSNQRVAVVGYPLLCTIRNKFRVGDIVSAEIHVGPDCRSKSIGRAKIRIDRMAAANPDMFASGNRIRNAILVDSQFSAETTSYLSDDYQVIPPGTPMRISGIVTYTDPSASVPFLESVVLGKAP